MKSSSTNNYKYNFLLGSIKFVLFLLCPWFSGLAWGQQVKNITRNQTFSTIQAAINDASTVAGDVIEISNGVYNEQITINKAITLQGESTNAIIKAPYSNTSSNANTVSINSENVSLKNLTITRNYGTTLQQWNECAINQGISFNTKSNIKLENLIVKDNRNGIYCANSQNATIINCVIENNRTGIQLTHNASGLVMTNNIIRNNFTHGVLFNFDNGLMSLTNAKVQFNSITDNWYSQLVFQRATGASTTNIGDFTGAVFSCNWYGVALPTINAIAAGEPGYTAQIPSQFGGENPDLSDRYLLGLHAESIPSYNPFLKNGTDLRTDLAGFQPMPNGCTPVVNKNRNTYFTTIQSAISDAATLAGDTILVNEGIFEENIAVTKSLVILGPNAGINPNTETRGGEAIIRPAVRQISSDNSTSGTIIRVAGTGHLDVVIKGFTIDGNNPSLSGGRVLNGVEVHTGAGIINSINSFDTNPGGSDATMIIQYNIIKNLERYGVLADGILPVKALAGTNVSYNKFDNIPSGDNFGGERGRAAAFEENHYGTFAHNVATRVNVGWQDDNYYRASPGTGTVVEYNEIHTYRRGIFHNLQYSNASTARIANNTIAKETSGNFAAAAENFGVEIASVQTNVGVTVESNDVSGMKYGILLWNNPTASTIKVSGGTLTNNLYGILATSNDPQFGMSNKASKSIISGVELVDSEVSGITIDDSFNYSKTSLTITDNTTISGGAKGLVLNGSNAVITDGSLNNTTFEGQTSNYIELIASTGDIDGGNATFGGKKAIEMSHSERLALEEKLVHKPDNIALGKICLPNSATLSIKSGSPSVYCVGSSTILVADINGAVGPFTIVYTDGKNETTINDYINGADIPISANSTTSYSLVSVSDNIGCSTSSGFGDGLTITVNPVPSKPDIAPTSATICAGTLTTLTATGCTEGILYWTGGLTGTSITISPTATKSYKVA
ncbi:right-handed parallel beta-helix repeat-containing protein, partial [Emticicia fontis]